MSSSQAHLASAPAKAPQGPFCSRQSSRRITRASNRNGNGGRPYYKCFHCPKFCCFDDERGNDVTNPLYRCGLLSKRQRASSKKGGKVFWTCRSGECDFYTDHAFPDQPPVFLPRGCRPLVCFAIFDLRNGDKSLAYNVSPPATNYPPRRGHSSVILEGRTCQPQ